MIITLKGADFSGNNIGTLDSWSIIRTLGDGATYSGVSFVNKGASYSGTITLADGYELNGDVEVTMGGTAVSGAVTVSGNTITISIASVTGNVRITVNTTSTGGGEGGDVVVPDNSYVFNYDFTTNTIDDYALDGVFTVPDNSTTSAIEYSSTYGMSLNSNLPNGLNLVNPIDASKAWEMEITATFVTPTVLAGNRRAFLGGVDLYPFVFINGSTYDNMGFQISNGSHATKYGILVYDKESSYKIAYDGNGSVEIFVNGESKGTIAVDFTGGQFTVILGNVSGKSSAYVWQNVETDKKSYLKAFSFKYVE